MKKIIVFLLAVFLSCGSVSAYAYGYIPDGWFGGKPVTPPVTPDPVTPPPPVQTATTEYGVMAPFTNETDWYFSKPIASYGKFDLFVGDKKYTISMAYEDSQIEVRNSETRRTMVVIAPASFKDKKAYISYPSGGTPTVPPVAPDPVTPPADGAIPLTTHYNHVNNWAFDGKGVAINMCKGAPGLKGATLNGVPMRLHGDRKENCDREIWTNVNFVTKTPTKVDGEIIIERRDGTKGRIEISGSRPYWHQNKGDCFINCGD